MKIFVSISSYDAILDASISSVLCKKKIIDHDVFTSLSYSKKDSETQNYQRYFDDINFIDAKEILENNFLKISEIPLRQFYSIYLNLKKALELNFDFMIILNSGSWLLSGKSVNEIIQELKNHVIGCRAMKYSNMKRLSCDDHFVFINLNNFKHTKFCLDNFYDLIPFDFNYGGIHTLLNNFFNKLEYKDTIIYSDLTESINIHKKFPKYLLPLNFDMKYKFLHSNKREKKVLAIRYCYLDYYANNCFDEFLTDKINNWKINSDLILKENGTFFYKEKYLQQLKNFLNLRINRKNYGNLEKIN